MPGRAIPLVTGEFYHIFNRGIDHRPTFLDKKGFSRAQISLKFYRFISPPMRLSLFLTLGEEQRKRIFNELEKKKVLVEIISYCLMPNHFHILLRQKVENGISKFMSNFQNSYTRYFNERNQRNGPLFLDQFKAVRVETEGQLLHLSRYIHLNPYSSYVVKNLNGLERYSWSSLSEFLGGGESFCKRGLVMSFFKGGEEYKKFVFDQADYQRELDKIKHLLLEA